MDSKEGFHVVQVSEGPDAHQDHDALGRDNPQTDSEAGPLIPEAGKTGKASKPGFPTTSKLMNAAADFRGREKQLCSDILQIIVLLRVQQLCLVALLVYIVLCLLGRFFPGLAEMTGEANGVVLSPTTFLQWFLALVLLGAGLRIRNFARKCSPDEKWVQPLASLRKFWRYMAAAYCLLAIAAIANVILPPHLAFLDGPSSVQDLIYLPTL